MTKTKIFGEEFRHQFLDENGFANIIDYGEELKRLRFFIEEIERFISKSETDEINILTESTTELSEDQKADFWMWHYPIHWRDVFGIRIRQSFCILLCSHIETLLSDISHRIQIIERQEFGIDDLYGRSIRNKAKLYFRRLADFQAPSSERWKEIDYIFQLRNKFVHSNGFLGDISDKNFESFLKTVSSDGLAYGFIELKYESASTFLNIVDNFQTSLLSEYDKYRQKHLEKDTNKDSPGTDVSQ